MKVAGLFRNAQGTMTIPTNRVVATLGPDDMFGEMALLDSSPRMATAVATVDTALAVINRHRFLFLVHETPTFALSVMSAMADRFRAQG